MPLLTFLKWPWASLLGYLWLGLKIEDRTVPHEPHRNVMIGRVKPAKIVRSKCVWIGDAHHPVILPAFDNKPLRHAWAFCQVLNYIFSSLTSHLYWIDIELFLEEIRNQWLSPPSQNTLRVPNELFYHVEADRTRFLLLPLKEAAMQNNFT